MKKIFSSKKRATAIGVLTAATLVGGGMAVAYWTNTGTGNGTATTGTSTGYNVFFDDEEAGGTAAQGTLMSPDGPTQMHYVTVVNQGSGAQEVQEVLVEVDPLWSASDGENPDCTAADFEIEDSEGTWAGSGNVLASPTTLDPSGGTTPSMELDVNVKMIDTGANQDACQDVSVDLVAAVS